MNQKIHSNSLSSYNKIEIEKTNNDFFLIFRNNNSTVKYFFNSSLQEKEKKPTKFYFIFLKTKSRKNEKTKNGKTIIPLVSHIVLSLCLIFQPKLHEIQQQFRKQKYYSYSQLLYSILIRYFFFLV